jgi:hypothetical protein
MATQGH